MEIVETFGPMLKSKEPAKETFVEKAKAYFTRQIQNRNYYFGDRCRIDGVEYIIDYHGVGFVLIKQAGKGNKKVTRIDY